MNRRSFFKWAFASLGATGFGYFLGNCFKKICSITLLDVQSYQKDITREISEILISDGLLVKGKRVLIKPNFVEYHQGRPINTNVSLIGNVSQACLSMGATEVVIAEGAGHRRDPWYSIHHPELRAVLDKNVRLIDLNHVDVEKIPNRGSYTGLPHLYLPTPIIHADFVIGMPKLKTHHWMGVTLSLKNLFGMMPGTLYGWPKNLLHFKGIGNSILDIAKSVPLHYVILDGIVGMEGDGPILGSPKNVGVVMFGRDPLAIDTTAARIMGFEPYNIPYFNAASWSFPGFTESSIVYKGEHPKRYATKFSCLPALANLQGGPFW